MCWNWPPGFLFCAGYILVGLSQINRFLHPCCTYIAAMSCGVFWKAVEEKSGLLRIHREGNQNFVTNLLTDIPLDDPRLKDLRKLVQHVHKGPQPLCMTERGYTPFLIFSKDIVRLSIKFHWKFEHQSL